MDAHYIEITSMENSLVKTCETNIITDEIELKKSGMLDGVTCFYTITNSVEVDAAKVIRNYRDKNKVEESFHKSKAILEYAQFSQQNKSPQT